MPTAVMEKTETKKASEQKRVYRAPINLYETGENYTMLVEVPGADEKSVQLRTDKGVLAIEAHVQLDLPTPSTLKYSELRLGDFRRSFELGDEIDEDKIEASLKNGLLKIVLPKSKTAKARKIPIKTV
jgi:HSP20 family protein